MRFVLSVCILLHFCILCLGVSVQAFYKLKHDNKYFTDGEIEAISTDSLSQCSLRCTKTSDCASVAFDNKDMKCVLLDHCPNLNCNTGNSDTKWKTYCKDENPTKSSHSKDCRTLFSMGEKCSTTYVIEIEPNLKKSVQCDMDTTTGGWTVIQTRVDGSVNFTRSMQEYKNGFGSASSDYWLGNEAIYRLITSYSSTSMYIEMKDWNNVTKYALYSNFSISSENDNYRLDISGYSGTAGDCLNYITSSGSTDYSHNGQAFSTYDMDNDPYGNAHCAEILMGGWWYSTCAASNLNGVYSKTQVGNGKHIWCKTFGNDTSTLQFVKMMVRGND